jgi:hypothetical protein
MKTRASRIYKKPGAWPNFDLQLHAEPYSPQGELETLGWGKETTFASFVAPTVWHAFRSWSGVIATNQVARAPRGSLFVPVPAPGGRTGSGSLDVETTADTFPMVLAYTLGKQTLTTGAQLYTGNTATAAIAIGDKTFHITPQVAPNLGLPIFIFPGMSLDVDTAGNKETFVVTAVDTWFPAGAAKTLITGYVGSPGSGFTKTHSSGTGVVGTNSHPLNTMGPGSPLPTFSQQINRPGSSCTDYLGCKIDSLALSWKPKQGLTAKASIVFADMVTDGSPTTAVLSAKNPYIMEQLFVKPNFFGNDFSNGINSSLAGIDLTISNNLQKDNFVGGGGNKVYNFPEGIRTLSGSLSLGFESANELIASQAAAGGGPLPLGSLILPMQGIDPMSPGDPIFIVLVLPKIFLPSWTAGDDTSKTLSQTIPIACGESTPGANDTITAYCPGVGTTKF